MIGKSLGIGETLDGADLLDAVRRGIEARPPWVMILDNADDLRLFGVNSAGEWTNEGLYRYIPQLACGTILWTSRDKNIAGTLVSARRGIEVQAMTNNEATLLLARTRDVALTAGEGGVADLLEELQRLPLAISQAGAYIRRMSITAQEYLSLLRQGKSRWEVLERSDFNRHRQPAVSNSVLETWRISIERIREESEMSYQILHVIAYVGSQDIPYELIIATGREDADDAGLEGREHVVELQIQQAAVRLQEFSFLTMVRKEDGGRSYDMHKLIQEAVRYGLNGQSQTSRLESEQSQQAAFYSRMAVRIIDSLFPISEQRSWGRCEQYLPHAIEASKWAETADMRTETAALLSRVSSFLNDRGRWGEKEPVDVRALELHREVLGTEHLNTLTSMANLALTYWNQGRWAEAETLQVQVMETTRRVLGAEHPDTLLSMGNLASTYSEQGRWAEAETLQVQAMEIRRRVLGAEHPDTLLSMGNLALTYSEQGRWAEAEMEVQVMETRRRVLGAEHPDTLLSMGNLASTYSEQGRWTEAEMLEVQATETRRRVLGAEHPHTLLSIGNLASIYRNQGRWMEAETLQVQVMETTRRVLGAEHPHTLLSMGNLASIYRNQGRWMEAETLQVQVMETTRRVLGAEHPDALLGMGNLASTYWNQGRWTEAETLQVQVMEIRRRVLGAEHPDTLSSMSNLASTYWNQGRWTEAETLQVQATETRRRVLGAEHPHTLLSMGNLASIYRNQGRWAEAETLEVQVMETRRRVLGAEHPDTLLSMGNLASTYRNQG